MKKRYGYLKIVCQVKDLYVNNPFYIIVFYFKILFYLYLLNFWFTVLYGSSFKNNLYFEKFGFTRIKTKRFIVLRSPFVNKKAREQFEQKYFCPKILFSLILTKNCGFYGQSLFIVKCLQHFISNLLYFSTILSVLGWYTFLVNCFKVFLNCKNKKYSFLFLQYLNLLKIKFNSYCIFSPNGGSGIHKKRRIFEYSDLRGITYNYLVNLLNFFSQFQLLKAYKIYANIEVKLYKLKKNDYKF